MGQLAVAWESWQCEKMEKAERERERQTDRQTDREEDGRRREREGEELRWPPATPRP